jgi:hypothetical protein
MQPGIVLRHKQKPVVNVVSMRNRFTLDPGQEFCCRVQHNEEKSKEGDCVLPAIHIPKSDMRLGDDEGKETDNLGM